MGLLRDKVDLASVYSDQARAAKAGGPKQYAKFPGRVRGADRFPARRVGSRKSSRRR